MSELEAQDRSEPISFGCPHMVGEARLPAYDALRKDGPVYQDPLTGNYVLTRYKDVRSTLLNHRMFKTDVGLVGGNRDSPVQDQVEAIYLAKGPLPGRNLQTYDPPEHRRHRAPIDRAFDHWKLEQLRGFIEEQANFLVDGFIGRGEVEFVSEFTIPFPLRVFADQLGLAMADATLLKLWADVGVEDIDPTLPPARQVEAAQVMAGMNEYLQRAIAAARAAPDDRLISKLVETIDPAGTHDGLVEIMAVLRAIIIAAGDTTTYGLGGGMRLLAENPHLVPLIRGDRDKLLAFVEEALRIVSPLQTLFRRAAEDSQIGGVAIPRGAIIEARYGAGNLDPAVFPCPYNVNLERENVRSHVVFGVAPHICPGMLLARTEMEIAFKVVTERMDNLRPARGGDSYEYSASYIAHGPVKAHIAFDRR